VSTTRDEVLAAIRAAFAADRRPHVESLLDAYGTEPHERERERVQLAILKISAGDEQKVREHVATAKTDYRDVLFWADHPEQAKIGPRARNRILETLGKLGVTIVESRTRENSMERLTIPQDIAEWNERGRDGLPGHLGMEFLAVEPDEVRARMRVEPAKRAWNGYLHAGAVVSLADTACGYATVRNLPADAKGFTTLELKSNFLGTALEGDVTCVARPVHKGRTTHVWDAEIRSEKSGKTIAFFRCTQMILR
jgi:uncharacterized protein (TIGR00369 family)